MNWHATTAAMEYLAFRISQMVDSPVVDKTGLEGGYDFDLAFTMQLPFTIPEGKLINGAPIDTSGATVFDAIRSLGLRLEKQRGTVDTVIVSHAERPSAN